MHPEPVVKKPAEVSAPPKEAERQLSKKEKKKKELAELEALLADFGVSQKESDSQDESRGKCLPFFLIRFYCSDLQLCVWFSFAYSAFFSLIKMFYLHI